MFFFPRKLFTYTTKGHAYNPHLSHNYASLADTSIHAHCTYRIHVITLCNTYLENTSLWLWLPSDPFISVLYMIIWPFTVSVSYKDFFLLNYYLLSLLNSINSSNCSSSELLRNSNNSCKETIVITGDPTQKASI